MLRKYLLKSLVGRDPTPLVREEGGGVMLPPEKTKFTFPMAKKIEANKKKTPIPFPDVPDTVKVDDGLVS